MFECEVATTKIQQAFRKFKEKKTRQVAAVRIQRWTRWHLLRRSIRKARKRAARRRKKAAKQALEAAERAKWTEAQLGCLVAIELAYGPPQNRVDWALRCTFVGDESREAAKTLGETVPGYPKALKDIQVKWEEMHASGELEELDLLCFVPPKVLDAILPPWHARRKKKSSVKKHSEKLKSSVKLSEVQSDGLISVESSEVRLEQDNTSIQPRHSFAKPKQQIHFREDVPPEYRSVAARFTNIQLS
jgi:hypothetical protein